MNLGHTLASQGLSFSNCMAKHWLKQDPGMILGSACLASCKGTLAIAVLWHRWHMLAQSRKAGPLSKKQVYWYICNLSIIKLQMATCTLRQRRRYNKSKVVMLHGDCSAQAILKLGSPVCPQSNSLWGPPRPKMIAKTKN